MKIPDYSKVSLLFVASMWIHLSDSQCPSNFVRHTYYKNMCYWVDPDKTVSSYTEAFSHCTSRGYVLANVYNHVIHNFLQSYFEELKLNENIFIGLNESDTWQNGLPLNWSIWKSGEPNTSGGKSCNFYNPNGSGEWKWRKHFCSTNGKVVCESLDLNNTKRFALVDGITPYRGRIEIYTNKLWGSICSLEVVNITNLAAICIMEGGIVGDIMSCNETTSQGTGPILAENLTCESNATTFGSCFYNESNISCNHGNDICIRCDTIDQTTTTYVTEDYCERYCSPSVMTETSSIVQPTTTTTEASSSTTTIQYSKKTSAKYSKKTQYDNRPSAVTVGTFGVGIIIGVFVLAVLADLATLGIHFSLLKRNLFGRKKGKANRRKNKETGF